MESKGKVLADKLLKLSIENGNQSYLEEIYANVLKAIEEKFDVNERSSKIVMKHPIPDIIINQLKKDGFRVISKKLNQKESAYKFILDDNLNYMK